jgi:hypothetical protein
MMFAANCRQTVLLLMLLALPATASAQAPTLSSQVPGPGETSSITTTEGGERTTTSCRTDTQRNTVCVNRSYQIAPPPEPAPLSPPLKAELERQSQVRERTWETYCKPKTYVDREGLTRYRYAAPNCDMAILSRTTPRSPWAPQD